MLGFFTYNLKRWQRCYKQKLSYVGMLNKQKRKAFRKKGKKRLVPVLNDQGKIYRIPTCLARDSWSLDCLLLPKISKRRFFRDISNSFQWVTQTALKPHQNFFSKKFWKLTPLAPFLDFSSFGWKFKLSAPKNFKIGEKLSSHEILNW